jgi:SAM-dependent methyltransferase
MKNYEKIQIDAVSYEEENPFWNNGQKKSIDMFLIPIIIDKNSSILDAACGDGSGLEHLYKNGYRNLHGVDLNQDKLNRAYLKVNNAYLTKCNISDLPFNNDKFDIIWSSHTLEHSNEPFNVLNEFKRVCINNGYILLILPYPADQHDIHCGSENLRLNINDSALSCINNLKNNGFIIEEYSIINIREPEIFIKIKNKK